MRNYLIIAVLSCLAALLATGPTRADDPIISAAPPTVVSSDPPLVEGPILGDHVEGGEVSYLPRFWGEASYLLLWTKGATLPPLVTTGPNNVLGPDGAPGVLGGLGTSILVGGERVQLQPASGARFVLGGWIDHDCCLGVEASYFFLAERKYRRDVSQPGVPGTNALSIPFFNPTLAQESSVAVAFPRDLNPISGRIILSVTTRVQGYEATGVYKIFEKPQARTDLLVGYRQLSIDEGLYLDTSSSNVGQNDVFRTSDSFRCSNDFHGLQVGARQQVYFHKMYFRGTAKVAVGNMRQVTTINGSLTTNDFPELNGQTTVLPGGYLAQRSNIGRFSTNRLAFIPELTAGVGMHVTDWLRVTASYTFLYVTSVVRPGDEINRTINPTQGPAFTGTSTPALMGPAQPTYPGKTTDYWLQGVNVGLEVRF